MENSGERIYSQVRLPAETHKIRYRIRRVRQSGTSQHAGIESRVGARGWYAARIAFCIPGTGVIASSVNFDELLDSGRSLVAFQVPQVQVTFGDRPDVRDVVLHTGERGRLAQASLQIEASDIVDAERKVTQILSAVVGLLAFKADTPIDVLVIELTDPQGDVRQWTHTVVGGVTKTFSWHEPDRIDLTDLSPQFKRLLSWYREGLNSFNPFYKFLCFWKITEWCRAEREQRAKQLQREGHAPPVMPTEAIPTNMRAARIDSEFVAAFQPHLGKEFSEVLDGMKGVLRNAITHFRPRMPVLDPDDVDDAGRCELAVPVVRYIAREMLLAEYKHGTFGNLV